MQLHVQCFTFNVFQENTYIVYSDKGDSVIIDPGCSQKEEENALSNFIDTKKLNVFAILNTHAHIDHVLGNSFTTEKYGVELYLHPADKITLQNSKESANLFGITNYKESPTPTQWLEDKQLLHFGDIKLQTLYTPGHSPGHVVFYNEENGFVINGDVLFQGSFGRVDLPGSDLQTLKNSIFNVMFQLPDSTTVFCGHGPNTNIAQEKRSNYILNF